MVVLNKIYTRTGDKGETALVNGDRVPKFSPRVEAYGTADELNAVLGVTTAGVVAFVESDRPGLPLPKSARVVT